MLRSLLGNVRCNHDYIVLLSQGSKWLRILSHCCPKSLPVTAQITAGIVLHG